MPQRGSSGGYRRRGAGAAFPRTTLKRWYHSDALRRAELSADVSIEMQPVSWLLRPFDSFLPYRSYDVAPKRWHEASYWSSGGFGYFFPASTRSEVSGGIRHTWNNSASSGSGNGISGFNIATTAGKMYTLRIKPLGSGTGPNVRAEWAFLVAGAFQAPTATDIMCRSWLETSSTNRYVGVAAENLAATTGSDFFDLDSIEVIEEDGTAMVLPTIVSTPQNSGSGGSVTLPTWTAGTVGEILIFAVRNSNGNTIAKPPPGYQVVANGVANVSSNHFAFRKRMTDADSGATVTATWDGSNTSVLSAVIIPNATFCTASFTGSGSGSTITPAAIVAEWGEGYVVDCLAGRGVNDGSVNVVSAFDASAVVTDTEASTATTPTRNAYQGIQVRPFGRAYTHNQIPASSAVSVSNTPNSRAYFSVVVRGVLPAAGTDASAEAATGSGAAGDASETIATAAEASTSTGTAYDATVTTASATNAPAEAATGTGTASDAAASVAPNAEAPSGIGAVTDPAASVFANAEAATGSGAASNAAPSISGAGGAATGTGASGDPAASLLANAAAATVTGSAGDATAPSSVSAFAGVATGSGTGADYPSRVLDLGPMAYWRLGEPSGDFADSSGNGRTLIANGSPGRSQPSIISDPGDGSAYFELDGVYGSVADSLLARPGYWTVMAWIRPSATAFEGEGAAVTTDYDGTYVPFAIRTPGGDNYIQAAFYAGGWNTAQSTFQLVQWSEYFVVARFDGTDLKLFIDGTENASVGATGIASSSNANVYVGRRWDNDTINFFGDLDEIAIFDYAVSATDIAALYGAGLASVLSTDATVRIDEPAAAATGSGSSEQPAASIAPVAEAATSTGSAYDATVTTAAATNASAEAATGSGSAGDAAPALGLVDAGATATATAGDPSESVSGSASASTASSTAPDAAASLRVNAEAATGTGSANDATAATAVAAAAEAASGTGTAADAAPAILVNDAGATATGSAADPSESVLTSGGNATATGTANDATATTSVLVSAEAASGTGAAADAASNVQPNAGASTSSGTGADPAPSVAPADAGATGSGSASDPAASLLANAEAATSSGTAYDATATTASFTDASAEAATGSGTAHDAAPSIAPNAEVATSTATAHDATATTASTTTANAEAATGSGTANGAAPDLALGAETATITGTSYAPSPAVATFAEAAAGSGSIDTTLPSIGAAADLADATADGIDAAIELWLNAELAAALGEAWDAGQLGPAIHGAVQTTVLLTPRRTTVSLMPDRATTSLAGARSTAVLTPGRDTVKLAPDRGTAIYIP